MLTYLTLPLKEWSTVNWVVVVDMIIDSGWYQKLQVNPSKRAVRQV